MILRGDRERERDIEKEEKSSRRGKEKKRKTCSNRENKSPYLTRNGTLWHFSMKSYR